MRERDGVQGICVTCRHAPTCLLGREARHPVWFCDEFESEPGAKAPPPPPHGGPGGPTPSGLCDTCESAEGCSHRRRLGVVSECAEFT